MDSIQWFGAGFGIVGAYLVASSHSRVRAWGFTGFLISNFCWIAWGMNSDAFALVVMQLAFCLTSGRGLLVSRRLALAAGRA